MVSTKPKLHSTTIELHVEDFNKVQEFYQKLGFEVVWQRKPEGFKGYMVLSDGLNILCFWGGNKNIFEHPYFKKFPKDSKRGYGVEIIIMVDDLDAVYESCKSFANIVEPMMNQPWGLRDFRIEDPSGYYLRITTTHDVTDPANAVK